MEESIRQESPRQTVLQVTGLSLWYRRRQPGIIGRNEAVEVLRDVNLEILKGEIFGLVGESGCGKSTLARAIMGLTPAQGQVRLGGSLVGQKRTAAQRRLAQIVFQDPFSSLNPSMRVGRFLEEPLRIHHIGTPKERAGRVRRMAEQVGLGSEVLLRYPRQLSGGQRQRVSLAAALMLEPGLLIADEATSALDVSVQAQILNLLQELHDRLDLSILFISHNLNVVYYLCDRMAVMYRGSIVELAPVRELFDNPLHPYTRELLSAEQGIGESDAARIFSEGDITEAASEDDAERQSGEGCPYFACCKMANKENCARLTPQLVSCGPNGHYVRCTQAT